MLKYKAIVIGVSAGGMDALTELLPQLPENFPAPVIIAQHLHPNQGNYFIYHYNKICKLTVKRAENNEPIRKGMIYFAPPNHHLLVNQNKTFAIHQKERIKFARPSIDLLFKTASDAYGFMLAGCILTGANYDGAEGAQYIKNNKGIVFVQDPNDAEVPSMPKAAINKTNPDYVLPVYKIGKKIVEVFQTELIAKNDKKRMYHTDI